MATKTIDPRNLTQEPCPCCPGKQVWVYGGSHWRPKPVALRCSEAPKCSWRKDVTAKRTA